MSNRSAAPAGVWDEGPVSHASPDRPRGWFARLRRRREPAEPQGQTRAEPTIDLRDSARPSAEDPAVVLEHLTRMRDAGLITNAELDRERRALLDSGGSGQRRPDDGDGRESGSRG